MQIAISPIVSGTSGIQKDGLFGAPRAGGSRPHFGVDVLAQKGSPVFAPRGGTVIAATFSGSNATKTKSGSGWGNIVAIDVGVVNGKHVTIGLAHLQDFTVKPGETVKAGQIIGHVGKTGGTSGFLVHVEVATSDEAMTWSDFANKKNYPTNRQDPVQVLSGRIGPSVDLNGNLIPNPMLRNSPLPTISRARRATSMACRPSTAMGTA